VRTISTFKIVAAQIGCAEYERAHGRQDLYDLMMAYAEAALDEIYDRSTQALFEKACEYQEKVIKDSFNLARLTLTVTQFMRFKSPYTHPYER